MACLDRPGRPLGRIHNTLRNADATSGLIIRATTTLGDITATTTLGDITATSR